MKRKNFEMSTQHLLHPEEQHMVEAVLEQAEWSMTRRTSLVASCGCKLANP